MFYVKNHHFSEFENYLFFLDYVYKKNPEYVSATQYISNFTEAKRTLRKLNDRMFSFFHEGKNVYQAIPKAVSFSQFLTHIDYNFIYRPSYDPLSYRRRFYTVHNEVDFRQPMKFVKNCSDIQQKDFCEKENQKKEWRVSTGLYKDKAKRTGKNMLNPNKKFKTCRNRSFRHKQNQLIREKQYDNVYDEQFFLYYDLWDWV